MNVYYNPEEYNLETIGEIEYSDANYQFDTTVVFYHASSNRIFAAGDAGCSCPYPFDDFTSIDDLTDITNNYADFLLREFLEQSDEYSVSTLEDVQNLIKLIGDKLRGEPVENNDWKLREYTPHCSIK